MDRFEIHILEVELIGHDYELKWEVRQRSVKFYSWFTTQKTGLIETLLTATENTGGQ